MKESLTVLIGLILSDNYIGILGHPVFVPGHSVLKLGHPAPLVPHLDMADKQAHGSHSGIAVPVVCIHTSILLHTVSRDANVDTVLITFWDDKKSCNNKTSPTHMRLLSDKHLRQTFRHVCTLHTYSHTTCTVQPGRLMYLTSQTFLATLALSPGASKRRGSECALSVCRSIAALQPPAGCAPSLEATFASREKAPVPCALPCALPLCTIALPFSSERPSYFSTAHA